MALPPGPTQSRYVQTWNWFYRPREWLTECLDRYGDPFTIRIVPFGIGVVVTDAEAIKGIITGDANQLHAGEAAQSLGPVLGDFSVILLDGPEHLRQRRLMLPSFHGERMRTYAKVMQDAAERDLETWPTARAFTLHEHMQGVTLDVILRTVFGLDEGAKMTELRSAMVELLATGANPVNGMLLLSGVRPSLGPWTPWERFGRRKAVVDDLIYHEIARRRRAMHEGARREDVLSMMLEAVDESGQPMSDVELRDELMTLLVAGHETTATALCWTVERILATPEVHERVTAEIDGTLRGERLRTEHLGELTYLDATIKEALRLRPIIPFVGRVTQSPRDIMGYEIPAGVFALPSVYLAQRSPKNYSRPEAFWPDRFVDQRPDPYKWLPFGGGIRRCLGMAFALYEMKIVLAALLSQRELRLEEKAPVGMVRRGITFAPKGGLRVSARPRARRSVAREPRLRTTHPPPP